MIALCSVMQAQSLVEQLQLPNKNNKEVKESYGIILFCAATARVDDKADLAGQLIRSASNYKKEHEDAFAADDFRNLSKVPQKVINIKGTTLLLYLSHENMEAITEAIEDVGAGALVAQLMDQHMPKGAAKAARTFGVKIPKLTRKINKKYLNKRQWPKFQKKDTGLGVIVEWNLLSMAFGIVDYTRIITVTV
jgi:hypothetical protein